MTQFTFEKLNVVLNLVRNWDGPEGDVSVSWFHSWFNSRLIYRFSFARRFILSLGCWCGGCAKCRTILEDKKSAKVAAEDEEFNNNQWLRMLWGQRILILRFSSFFCSLHKQKLNVPWGYCIIVISPFYFFKSFRTGPLRDPFIWGGTTFIWLHVKCYIELRLFYKNVLILFKSSKLSIVYKRVKLSV